jgi:hypothetical protein
LLEKTPAFIASVIFCSAIISNAFMRSPKMPS